MPGAGTACAPRSTVVGVSTLPVLPVALVIILLVSDAWVYADAQRHADSGRPVEMSIGSVRIDTPVLWTLGCLLLWIVFLPLYITQRTHA